MRVASSRGSRPREEDGHEEGSDLCVGDELMVWGAVDDGADECADLGVGEGVAVALVEDDVDGMDLAHLVFEEEGCGEKVGDSGAGEGAVGCGEEDFGGGGAELVDGLAAGSAGLGGGGVEVSDDDGADTDGGSVEGDSGGDGGLLGAGGEAVGGVLDIAAGDDVAVLEEEGGAYAEVAVGSSRRCGLRRLHAGGGLRSVRL